MAWYENTAAARAADRFSPTGESIAVPVAPDPTHVSLADVDNDGAVDIVYATNNGTYMALYWLRSTFVDGGGVAIGFEAVPRLISSPDFAITSVALGDIDDDGDVDVCISTCHARLGWREVGKGGGRGGGREGGGGGGGLQ